MSFTKLTRRTMRKLQRGEKITEHGIIFDRLPDGDGRFTINIMVDGQRIRRVIGRESAGTTRTQAEDFIDKVRQEAKEGRLNLPKGRKLVLRFDEAAGRYLDKLIVEGGRDIDKKRERFNLHLAPFFGNKPLSKISAFDVERYKKHRHEAGASPGTINRELACLSHLFTKAVEWKWVDFKPAQIKRLKEDKGRITYLTIDQIKRLIEAAKGSPNPHVYPFIVIGLETSMRRMEILSIQLEHIDLERRVIYIPMAKGGAREQPITQHLADFLSGYVEAAESAQEWLFPAPRSKTGHVVSIEKAFRRVVKAADLDPKQVVRHTFRHTAITHLVQAGVDLPTVQRISGHKTLQMVVRYSHQNGEHIQTAMDKLEERYQRNR